MTVFLNLAPSPIANVASQQIAPAVATIAATVTPSSISIFSMFLNAGLVVQIVMLLLIIISIISWGIAFEKFSSLRNMTNKMNLFEKDFWSGNSLEQLFTKRRGTDDNPLAMVFTAALDEWRNQSSRKNNIGSHEFRLSTLDRVTKAMHVATNRANININKNLSFLATVGSTATFVGLFGTVWGIMSSFQSIAASKNASLAVVAPGIAEALLATALGLVAAIPAVIFYNKFTTEADEINNRVYDFSTELSTLISREMEKSE